MKKIDVAIIGAGPAGISAAIYAKMDNINYVLIEKNKPCWFLEKSINSHYYAEGFTGIKKNTSGTDLRKAFLEHYKRLGGKIAKNSVIKIEKTNNNFKIKTTNNNFIAKAIIIASGTNPKTLNIFGSKTYKKYIHYSCTIDGGGYKGKNVSVIGGRNSGSVAACYLHDIGCNVSLIEARDGIQCKEKYKKMLKKRKIKIYTSTSALRFIGDQKKLKTIELFQEGFTEKIPAVGAFLYIGLEPAIDYCNLKLKTNDEGYLVVDINNQTSQEGIFAAGDVTCRVKQAITACGDGANAYYFAKKYIDTLT